MENKKKTISKIFNNKFPILVAELSANHNGKFEQAKKLIKCAKENGADAVKLQTYTADTMTIKSNKKYFKIKKGLWRGNNLWNLYNLAHTPYKWHKELFNYARKIGILCFSTPFDENAVDFLEKLKCPIYKVASFEMTDIPLIKKIAKTRKPMIISTGMANLNEIKATFDVARKNGASDITLLYCVSNYPSNINDFHLNNIKILKDKFKCRVGLSDHSVDMKITAAAIAAGADVIEKHIALKNQKKGFDIKFSIKGNEIKKLKNIMTETYKLVEKKFFYRNKNEKINLKFRRSIFVVKKIRKNEKFSKANIRRIRPGYGAKPMYYEKIIGKKSVKNLSPGTPFDLKFIK